MRQSPVRSAPEVPASPAPGTQGVPTTGAELEALIAKRSELSNQLEQLTERRRELQGQRERMSLEGGRPHEARIKVIDERSSRIESEILQADDAIAKAIAGNVIASEGGVRAGTRTTMMPVNDRVLNAIRGEAEDAIMNSFAAASFAVIGALLLWRGFRRFVWKRKKPAAVANVDHTNRLEQLQQSMDVIAIEVERISEAQRFTAKLLNEKTPALGAGPAEHVPAHERESVRSRMGGLEQK